jgi:ABC-2 type transport system permease protein
METKKIWWMIKKDLLTLWRHKPRLISMILFPIIMIALCGWGMGGEINHTPVVIAKQSTGDLSDQTIADIKSDKAYDVKDIKTDVDDAKDDVDNGKVKAAIILPKNYDSSDKSKNVILYIDSSDQVVTNSLVPTTQKIISSLSEQAGVENVKSNVNTTANSTSGSNMLSSVGQAISLQVNKIYGDIDYIDFLLPGVLAMSMYMSAMFSMGNSIAGERERGELARLFMTPTSIATVVGGKIISQLTVEFMRSVLLIITAVILFSVMMKGNVLLLLLLLVLCTLCFVGFGMMFSAASKTQEDYLQIIMPIAMPMMFISGVFFPIETMPWVLQKIAYILPLTYANDAFRAVMLKGVGIGGIAIDLLVLIGFTLVFFAIGVARFNRDI